MEPVNIENARVFIVGYKGSDHLLEKCLASAEACGNDTSKWILVRTDGSDYDSPHRKLILDVPQGHPVSVNRAYVEVAKLCCKNKDNFIFFDADCTILGPEAIERISFELVTKRATVLAQPHWVTNEVYWGWCFNGNAAYKWDAYEKFGLDKNTIPDDDPFDLYLSKRFYGYHAAPTGLFAHSERITNAKSLDFIQEVSPGAVMQHPCLDGSVADCVIKKFAKPELVNA